MKINVEKINVGKLRTNSYLVWNDICTEDGKTHGFLIDPSFEEEMILEKVKKQNVQVDYILLTHGHFDHVYMVNEIKEKLEKIQQNKVFVCINENGKEVLKEDNQNLMKEYVGTNKDIQIDYYLKDTEEIDIFGIKIRNIFIGGHTKDSSCYFLFEHGILFSGDTLFFGSIGRTDLVGSDYNQEVKNIKEKILILNEDVNVYPGHGHSTTISHEKRENEYLK